MSVFIITSTSHQIASSWLVYTSGVGCSLPGLGTAGS